MPTSEFVFFDAGGGHRAAATALKDVMEQQNGYWDVRLLNLRDVLGSLDIFRKLTGIELEEIYNRMLANGWTLGSPYLLPGIHALIRLYEGPQVRLLSQYWTKHPCDMVVSVVPNFNRGLFKGLRRANSGTPYVTILTDFADYPPHFWIERQDQYLICGTEQAVKQAKRMGFDSSRVYRTSGMILRPTFYMEHKHDRKAELLKLGLDPNLRTGVVLFGGMGSPQMRRITELLEPLHDQLQLILICGRNQTLADRLRSISGTLKKYIVEFTTDVPFYMSLGRFLYWQAGAGQYLGGAGDEASGHHRTECAHAATGTL